MITKGSHRINLPMSNLLKGGKPATFWISDIYQLGATALIAVSVDSFDEKELLPLLNGWQVGQSHSSKGGHSQQEPPTWYKKNCTYSALHIFHNAHTTTLTYLQSNNSSITQFCHTVYMPTELLYPQHQWHDTTQTPVTLHTYISDMTLPKHQSHYTLQHQWYDTTQTPVTLHTSTSVTSHYPNTSRTTHFNIHDITLPEHQSHYTLQHQWHHTNQAPVTLHFTNFKITDITQTKHPQYGTTQTPMTWYQNQQHISQH